MSDASVKRIVIETFNVLLKTLSEGEFIKQPDSTAEWRNITKGIWTVLELSKLCRSNRWKTCYYSVSSKRSFYVF